MLLFSGCCFQAFRVLGFLVVVGSVFRVYRWISAITASLRVLGSFGITLEGWPVRTQRTLLNLSSITGRIDAGIYR